MVVLLTLLGACGRFGFDELGAAPDAAGITLRCPAAMVEVEVASACIEQLQRGSTTWTEARASCEALGRRLCTAVEWVAACSNESAVTGMTDDWEWLAEEAGGIADKRGSGGCDQTAVHEIFVDSFGYRCCAATL